MSSTKYFVVFFLIPFLTYVRASGDVVEEESPLSTVPKEEYDSERIVGGAPTTVENFPFMAGISVANATMCGGFIISKSYILTAASCVDGALPGTITARVGSSTFGSGGAVYQIARTIIHAGYFTAKSSQWDYAILQVNGTIAFSNSVKAVAIPEANSNPPIYASFTVAGYGATTDGGPPAATLQVVTIRMVNKRLCKLLYRGVKDIDNHYCAGRFIFGNKGVCTGDIGSAAIYKNVAYGIAAFGVTCGSPVYPFVFLAIPPVTDWIKGETAIGIN